MTRGQFAAAVIEFTNFSASDSLAISCLDLSGITANYLTALYPSVAQYGASWASAAEHPMIALRYDDGSVEPIGPTFYPISAMGTLSVASNTDPKEIGLYFKFPVPVKVGGFWLRADLDGDCDFVLYDSDGTTELESVIFDEDYRRGATAGGNIVILFATERALVADTWYRLAVQPTSTTAITLYYFDVNSAANMDGIEGGQNFHYTAKAAADTWSQTTTRRLWVGLLVAAVDDGVADFPDVGNVTEDDTVNGSPGTFVVPAVADVEDGVQYGAGGTEFEGTLVVGGGPTTVSGRPEIRGANL